MKLYINLVLACSNFVAIPLLYNLFQRIHPRYVSKSNQKACDKSKNNKDITLVSSVTVASILQHLSDIKHQQIGLWPLKKYAWYFLNLDRIMCIITGVYMLPRVISLSFSEKVRMGKVFGFGLVMMIASEIWFGPNNMMMPFLISHSLWHFSAYAVLSRLCTI